jgi:hypothetical protein
MGWGSLRVWNDDEIAGKSGFPPHPHSDMEIITYVREGAITHQDSLGNQGKTEAGDVQVMSAGTGVRHAEYNLESDTTKIFQIWIQPEQKGGPPAWGAKPFPKGDRQGRFVPLASGFDSDVGEALMIRTPARVAGATILAGETATYDLGADRHAYLVSAKGAVEVNGVRLEARDGRRHQGRAGADGKGAGRRRGGAGGRRLGREESAGEGQRAGGDANGDERQNGREHRQCALEPRAAGGPPPAAVAHSRELHGDHEEADRKLHSAHSRGAHEAAEPSGNGPEGVGVAEGEGLPEVLPIVASAPPADQQKQAARP